LSVICGAALALFIGGRTAQAQTVFTASCFGNTTVWNPTCGSAQQNALDESATITFPGTVPINGSTFSSPASLNVTMDGLTATTALPSYLQYSYIPPESYINIPSLLITGGPNSASFLDVTLAGPVQTNNFEPLGRGVNSAYFALPTQGQNFDLFNTSGSYALPSGFNVSQVGELFTSSIPSPSLYLTVNTGGRNSLPTTAFPNGQPTAITANLTLATTPPSLPGTTVPLPFALPSYVATLQQAAVAINPDFVGVDWEQTWLSIPSPSPYYSNANPFSQITAPPVANDPPFEGYAVGHGDPWCSVSIFGSKNYSAAEPQAYPFYYAPTGPSGDCLSLSTQTNSDDTTLSFFDSPSDSCLPGGSGSGCFGETDPAGSELAFETQLVGIVPIANADDFFGAATCNPLTFLCAVPIGPDFFWTDTFNGTTGGLSLSESALPVDPDSGSGGITVVSVNASVPEPPAILLLLPALIMTGLFLTIRQKLRPSGVMPS
jgi:hypothetical protein